MLNAKDLARFEKKIDKTAPDGCWLWTSGRHHFGHGRFTLDGKAKRAHRIMWSNFMGSIPKGKCILHKCDTPACVQPLHLFMGTIADNNKDMVRKGRQAAGDRHGSRTHPGRLPRGDQHWARKHPERLPFGEDNWKAKLTEQDVMDIRRRHAAGGETQRKLAAEFDVHFGTINHIVRRKTWRHVN